MNKQINLDDIIEVMTEKLNSGGKVTFSPMGKSMLPMLRDGEDAVVLVKPQGRLHLFDLPLYRRENGTYVLHRIVDFDSDGSYVMRGDNQFAKEHGIRDENIIAVVVAFNRKGKPYTVQSLRYRLYTEFWYYIYPFRRLYSAFMNRVKPLVKHDKKDSNNDKKPD